MGEAGRMTGLAEQQDRFDRHHRAWDHYRADSGLHATFWVAELPRRDVHAAAMSRTCRSDRIERVTQTSPGRRR